MVVFGTNHASKRPSRDVVPLAAASWCCHAATKPPTHNVRCRIRARDCRGLRRQRADRLRRYRETTRDGYRGIERGRDSRIRNCGNRRDGPGGSATGTGGVPGRRERTRSRPDKRVTARTVAAAAGPAAKTCPARRAAASTAEVPVRPGSLDAAARQDRPGTAAPRVRREAAVRPASPGAAARPAPPDAAARPAPPAWRHERHDGRWHRRRRQSRWRGRADVHGYLHDHPRTYCAGSSCHSPGSQGGVGFSSQSSAYSAVSRRVTAGNGAGSSFYNTVNSGSMPRGASKLSAANLAKIKAWIDAGALNN